MSPLFTSLPLLLIVITSVFHLSQAASKDNLRNTDSSESSADIERRIHDLKKLRHYLLTSNTEERAAKREQGNFLRRQLIREYLDSVNDPDSDRFLDVKKRFNYCTDEEMMNDSLCRRRGLH